MKDHSPELESVEAFAEALLDDERFSFTFAEAVELALALGFSVATPVIRALKVYGFRMAERRPEKQVRGFNADSHDRWYGKGSCPTHGGSGWEQITGFGGQQG